MKELEFDYIFENDYQLQTMDKMIKKIAEKCIREMNNEIKSIMNTITL